ncbi:glycosyltransferase [Patescibacteria group bacterium]|nr:glycosyltransferase [Patescibacteria group bacterium]
MKYTNILLFAIPSTLHTGHFNQYFIENSNNLYLYIMPLSTQPPEVRLLHYHNGEKISEKKYHFYKGSNRILRYVFFYIYYALIVIGILPRRTIVFATIPLFCFMNSIFAKIKSVRIVYHIGDYYPHSQGLMKLYQTLVHHYNQRLKYVVYASPLLESILRTGKPKVAGNRDYWIHGVVKKPVVKKPIHNLMGYVGVLRNGQGLEMVFTVLQQNPRLKLEIIGEGPALSNLKATVTALKLERHIKFYGLVQEENIITNIVKRWQIGLAPYDPSPLNMTYYTDPSKVKFYLEYRLPVIMTKITYMADELRHYHGGICIDYDSSSLGRAIGRIQDRYDFFLAGVDKLVDVYEYHTLYDRQFRFFRNIF